MYYLLHNHRKTHFFGYQKHFNKSVFQVALLQTILAIDCNSFYDLKQEIPRAAHDEVWKSLDDTLYLCVVKR